MKPIPPKRKNSFFARILLWFCYTIVFSLLPLFGFYFALLLDGHCPTRYEMLERGELFGICCALAAAGIGDAFTTENRNHGRACAAFCIVIVVTSIIGFVTVNMGLHHGKVLDKWTQNFVAQASIWLFIVTTFATAVCVSISQEKEAP